MEYVKLLLKKTFVFTVIGFLMAYLFANNNDDSWIIAPLSIQTLIIMTMFFFFVYTLNLLSVVLIKEDDCLYKYMRCLCKYMRCYDCLVYKEMLEAYLIVLTYLTGLYLGMFLYDGVDELQRKLCDVIVLGYFLQILICVKYKLEEIVTCILKIVMSMFKLKNDNKAFGAIKDDFLKKINIALNVLYIIFLICYFLGSTSM